jgi:glycosyltransferase involved in cell wall biosynthesis
MTTHTQSTVSALITTYRGESPDHLVASLQSLKNQSLPLDQIVLVIDGPIDPAQQDVIHRFAAETGGPTRTVVAMPENGGLAKALNHGLAACTGDYIMRMDSDDICLPDRLQLEKAYLDTHAEIDLVASWSSEFVDEDHDLRLKTSPTEHDAIVQALRWRNVIAHPTILIRKSVLISLGGYRETVGLLEDYDLYVRLILAGAKIHIIPKVLLRVRTTFEQRARRGNFAYFKNEFRFRLHCLRVGFLNTRQFLMTTCLYGLFRLIGTPLRDRLYAAVRS